MSNSSIIDFLRRQLRKSYAGRNEIAIELERQLVYVISWPTLVFIFSLQAIFAKSPISTWQIAFIVIAWFLLGTSYLLLRWLSAPYAFSITGVYLLFLPFIFQDPNAKPWMSYGLIVFIVTFLAVDIGKWFISIPLVGLLTVLQQFVSHHRFTSISDSRDISALQGYFSSLWVFGFGFGAFWVLREYLRRATSLEESLSSYQKEIYARLRNINKLNRRDYRNIQLHGTVLNTLNGALLNPEIIKNPKSLSRLLRTDIESLLLDPVTEGEVRQKFKEISSQTNLRVFAKIFPWPIIDRRISAQSLELIRELLINTQRHTTADRAWISVEKKSDNSILLQFRENSLRKTEREIASQRVALARGSRTIKRLIQGLDAQISIDANEDASGLIYRIQIPLRPEEIDPAEIIYRMRISPINFFTTGLARLTIGYSVFCLPGYFQLHLDWRVLGLVIISTLVSISSIFIKEYERILVYAGAYLAVLGFAVGGMLFQGCDVGVYIPWLFNYAIGLVFLAAITGRNKIFRWAPAALFTLESLFLPKLFYVGCENLLAGSTPGLIVIVLCAIATIRGRQRYSRKLALTTSGIYSDNEKLANAERAIDVEAEGVITEIAKFAELIESRPIPAKRLINEIRRQVDLARAFLLCSEHFESAFIRELYDFSKDRFADGQTTRLQIYGENFAELQDEQKSRAIFTMLYESLDTKSLEITLQGLDRVTLQVTLDAQAYSKYKKSRKKLPTVPGISVLVGTA